MARLNQAWLITIQLLSLYQQTVMPATVGPPFQTGPVTYVFYDNSADTDFAAACPPGSMLAVIEDKNVFRTITLQILEHTDFANPHSERYWINGKKSANQIPFLVDDGDAGTSNRHIPYQEWPRGETQGFDDVACAYITKNGEWGSGACDGSDPPVQGAICQDIDTDVACPTEDCDPSNSITLDDLCVWKGDEEETYYEAWARCRAYPNGEMLPIYTATERDDLAELMPVPNGLYFVPFTMYYDTTDTFNYRWPNGDAFDTAANSPFDLDTTDIKYNSFEASNEILVWDAGPAGEGVTATFQPKDTFKAKAICMQPRADYECSFDVQVLYGSINVTKTDSDKFEAVVTCDPGYELAMGDDDHFECSCPQRVVTGTITCNETLECLSSPCQNDGTCVEMVDSYECLCPRTHIGIHCQDEVENPCSTSSCSDNSTCTYNDDSEQAYCLCDAGFTGELCEEEIEEPCDDVNCGVSGTCVYTEESSEGFCLCDPGYTGDACQIHPCEDETCSDRGTCWFNNDEDTKCFCDPGYTGPTCNHNIDECYSKPCKNGGKCTDKIDGYSCLCAAGFAGDNCETNVDDCKDSPCDNAGICFDGTNKYTCFCQPGFTGDDCEINENECYSYPCWNDGSCVDDVNRYKCYCKPGYAGAHCEFNINECQPGLCYNGGICIDEDNSYTCNCPPRYDGDSCEKDLCEEKKCLKNGGECFVKDRQPYCACFEGFTGSLCDIRITPPTQRPTPPRITFPQPPPYDENAQLGYIIGGTLGGILLLAIIGTLAALACRPRSRTKTVVQQVEASDPFTYGTAAQPYIFSGSKVGGGVPPAIRAPQQYTYSWY